MADRLFDRDAIKNRLGEMPQPLPCELCGHSAYCHAPNGDCVPENVACREGCPYCAATDIAALLAANQRLKDENERLTRLADLAAEWARQGRVTCAQCGMRFWGDFCGPTHATIAALLDSHDTAEVGS